MKNKGLTFPGWLSGEGRDHDIIISSRVRLARNFKGVPFPQRMKDEEKRGLLKEVEAIVTHEDFKKEGGELSFVEFEGMDPLLKNFYLEKHLISPNMLRDSIGRGVLLGLDESISILVNEEDHLRLQCFRPGFDLVNAYHMANKLDDAFEKQKPFAFHESYGYLTACPTNMGTGIRFSVMIHLPALGMTRQLEKVRRDLNHSGYTIRGFFGEGTDSFGDLYQISNQKTIGEKEEVIMEGLAHKIEEIIAMERKERENLFKNRSYEMLDLIYRAFGTTQYAHLLSAKEGMNILSRLRLGLSTGYFKESQMDYEGLSRLIVLNQVNALQVYFNQEMSPEERDRMRPILFREMLNFKKEN